MSVEKKIKAASGWGMLGVILIAFIAIVAVFVLSIIGLVSADEAGLARWITHYCAGIVYGAQVGRDVARHVQAGRLS